LYVTARVFLIHPTTMTLAPIEAAFRQHWPEANRFNLIEESLYDELDADGTMTPAIRRRLRLLFEYCVEARGDAIVCNGVTFGPAIDAAGEGLSIPVLKPITAMAVEAVGAGRRIAVLSTSKRSMPAILREIETAAGGAGLQVQGYFVAEAQACLAAGDGERHDRLIAAAVERIEDCEVIALAQAPMASAARCIANARGRAVLTTPDCAVRRLRALLHRRDGDQHQ
jgi:Asp/Glu/hydantoin racemase